jgi:outer membrane lipoprotein-sorting protein
MAALAALTASPAFAAGLSPEDKVLADKAVAGLQALGEVKARFEQTDARGGRVSGALYLKRPGKARFAYDPPSGLTVVSDGHTVAVADTRLKTFSRYPLSATPLALFLAQEVRMDRGVTIVRVDRRPDGFSVTARDGAHKTRGSITLDFGLGDPAPLKGWSLQDAQGAITRVRLDGLAGAPGLDPALFTIRDTRARSGVARPGM